MLPTQIFYDKLITNKKIKNTKRSAHVFCTFQGSIIFYSDDNHQHQSTSIIHYFAEGVTT